MEYRTELVIDASRITVWDVLADVDKWPEWDSGVLSIDGSLVLGGKLKTVGEADPKRTFTVKVDELDPPNRMVWKGGMPLGLFSGVRTYELSSSGPEDTSTRFEMVEEFSGPLLGLIKRSMPDLQPFFDKFAAGLKAQVERR
jgi:hypothetical protein